MMEDAFDQQHGIDVRSVGKSYVVCFAEIKALPTTADRPVGLTSEAWQDSLAGAERVKEAMLPVWIERGRCGTARSLFQAKIIPLFTRSGALRVPKERTNLDTLVLCT